MDILLTLLKYCVLLNFKYLRKHHEILYALHILLNLIILYLVLLFIINLLKI